VRGLEAYFVSHTASVAKRKEIHSRA